MLVNSIQNYNIYTRPNIPQKKVNFTAHYDLGKVQEQTGDGIIYNRGFIHNYSALARDMQLFLEMPQMLEQKFPNGVKIYDYGCSAGYEPTSIVLGLYNHFPEDKVDSYTPIIARDKNPQILKIAKNYRLRFEDDERERLGFFENIDKNDFLIARRSDAYGQKIFDCTDKLKQKIIYEEGDLFEDLDRRELSEEPCVVLLRNAWQYITPMGRQLLSEKLYSKLQPKSMVIIGSCDLMKEADKNLLKAGFKQVDDDFDMTFKNKVLSARYEDSKAFNPLRTKHFCFVKE